MSSRPGELLAAIEQLLGEGPRSLRATIEAILGHPDRTLHVESHLVAIEEMQDPDPDLLTELMNDPASIRQAGGNAPHFTTVQGGFCFAQAWDRRPEIRYDTRANAELLRLVEWVLLDLRRVGPSARATELRRQVEAWRQALVVLGVTSRGGQTASCVVLEQDPRYREIRHALFRYRRMRWGMLERDKEGGDEQS